MFNLKLVTFSNTTSTNLIYCFSIFVKKGTKLRIADFVHGTDGLGNQNFPPPKAKPIEQSAAAFLVEQANLYPGKVTVVALGPLTNIALVNFLSSSLFMKHKWVVNPGM